MKTTEPRAEAPSTALEARLATLAVVVVMLVGYGWSLGFQLHNAHNGPSNAW